MNIPLMLSNTGSVRLAAHPTRSDANEIVIGDGQASVTLATNVLDSVALLFARAYDTAHKASSMRGELTDIMRDPTTPEQLRSRISGLLHGLYGDSQVACSAHGQYHPCGKCAEEHRKNKPVLACLAHPAETLPCPACATPGKTQKDLETCAREQGWRPVSELPPLAPYGYEDEARCVVVWINAENPSGLCFELSKTAIVRRGDYADDGRKLQGAWWRALMDAPPAAEWACRRWKPFGADSP